MGILTHASNMLMASFWHVIEESSSKWASWIMEAMCMLMGSFSLFSETISKWFVWPEPRKQATCQWADFGLFLRNQISSKECPESWTQATCWLVHFDLLPRKKHFSNILLRSFAITKMSLHKLWVVVAVSTCSIYDGQDWRLAWQSGIWCIPKWSNWEKRSDFLHLLTSQLCVQLFPMNRFALSLILLDWKLFFVCYLNPVD